MLKLLFEPEDMAEFVPLSGLAGLTTFDAVGEPVTLATRWEKWIAEYKIYVTASGVKCDAQKRALLLHVAGPGVRDIVSTYPEDTRGGEEEYEKVVTCLTDHFKL